MTMRNSTWLKEGHYEWEGVKSAIKNTNEHGTRYTDETCTIQFQRMDSFLKGIPAETKDPRDEIDERMRRESWEKIFSTLTAREHLVIRMRFFEDKTLAETGKRFKVDKERVRQIELKAIRKLRGRKMIDMMRKFDIPIHEEWYPEKELPKEEDAIPIKPEWVNLEFQGENPYLSVDIEYVWYINPITRKVYDAWLSQARKEHEANTA